MTKLRTRLVHATTAFPCASCRCGSLCHWDDDNTPTEKTSTAETAAAWAQIARGVDCQRCPKCPSGYQPHRGSP